MEAVLARLEDATQRGDVAALVAELRAYGSSPAHAQVVLWACAALGNTFIHPEEAADNRAEAAAAGAIVALLRTLRAHGADAAIQRQALWALINMHDDADTAAEASRLGAVDVVVAALRAHAADVDVQVLGFGALHFLLQFCSQNRIAAWRAGAIDAALAALRIHNVLPAAWSLGELLADEHSRAAVANRADVVPSFVTVMSHGSSVADVQSRGCRALYDILRGSTHATQTSAGAAGAVKSLVCALSAFPGVLAIQQCGCAALRSLVADHEANAAQAGACGAVEAVLGLLRLPGTDPRVLAAACDVLAHLTRTHALCEQNLQRAVDAGAFDAVLAVVRSNCEDAELAAHGCEALHFMLAEGVCCQEPGRGLAVDTAALVMRTHSQDAVVQAAAVTFLVELFFCLTSGSYTKLAWQGHEVALAAVLAAMQSHVALRDLSGLCAGALVCMLGLGNESVQAKAAALGAFEVIMATMEAHKLDARTQARACGAVEQLIAGSPARTRDAGAAGAVVAVLSALSLHSADSGVQFRGYHTLLALIAVEGNVLRALRAGALRLKCGVRNVVPELVRCRNAVVRELERAAADAAEAAAAELLASEELERGAAAAVPKPAKSKKKRGGGAGGAGGASGSGGGQALLAATSNDAASAASAAQQQPPPQAADADDDADDAALPSHLSALAARRRRRTATKAARRRGVSTGGAMAAEAAGEEPAPDEQPEEAPDAAPQDDADADDAAALPLAAQMQQMHVQPAAAAPLQLHGAAEDPESPSCVICLDAPRSVLLFPCKHLALCSAPACAAMMGAPPRCPLCRVMVLDTLAGVFW